MVEPSIQEKVRQNDFSHADKQQYLEGTPLAIEYNAEVLEDRPQEGQ